MHAILADGLTKRYGRAAAVDDVSFSVAPGEIVGFLGPNGAGKTTTLRMLAGLIRPTAGSGWVLGVRVPGRSLTEVGTMIEEPSFYPYMTGRDNLVHTSLLHGGVERGRIDEVLAFVKMDKAALKRVKAYSQGMRQRLALARALLWRPRVLLLDEPANGLDPVGIAEIRENLRAVAREGATILVSSHILGEIEKLVDRILAIEKGRLVFDGPLASLLARIDATVVRYHLRATDGTRLLDVLASLGFTPERDGANAALVDVAAERADDLVQELVAAGVRLTEARRHEGDLEDAYLRLVHTGERPS